MPALLPHLQLTWFTQPYVQRLRYDPTTEMVEATTLTLFAQPRTDRFHLNEVGRTWDMLVSRPARNSSCVPWGCSAVLFSLDMRLVTEPSLRCSSQVTEADSVHPLTSFAARGRKYYVDAQNFPNKDLLVRGRDAQHVASTADCAWAAQSCCLWWRSLLHGKAAVCSAAPPCMTFEMSRNVVHR